MWDIAIIIDRVLSFTTTRRHLLFFFAYPSGELTVPFDTMLARQGNDMVYLLETLVEDCERDGIPYFHAVVHPYFLQGPTYAPLTYDAPDFPRFLTFAAVSHCWYQAVLRAVRDRVMIDLPHLLRVSQRLEDTFEWIHRPNEDRFRFRAWLIYEINLLRIIGPV